MNIERATLSLVPKVYEAAADPSRWPAVLRELATTLCASTPSIFAHNPASHLGHVTVALDLDNDARRRYTHHFASRNVLLIRGSNLLRSGSVRTAGMMCPADVLLRSEYYNDFLRPLGLRHGLGGTILSAPYGTINIALWRPPRASDFSRDDLNLLRVLMPHLELGLRLQLSLAEITATQHALVEAVEYLSTALMIVTDGGKIVRMNRSAALILAKADGLAIESGRLRGPTLTVTAAIATAIGAAIETAHGTGARPPATVRVPRPSGRRPLAVRVAPLPRREDLMLSVFPAAAAVFVTDPDHVSAQRAELMQQIFDLSPAEANVAALVSMGLAINAMANELCVTRETIRTHLKRCFAKTSTHSQAELTRVVLLSDRLL